MLGGIRSNVVLARQSHSLSAPCCPPYSLSRIVFVVGVCFNVAGANRHGSGFGMCKSIYAYVHAFAFPYVYVFTPTHVYTYIYNGHPALCPICLCVAARLYSARVDACLLLYIYTHAYMHTYKHTYIYR